MFRDKPNKWLKKAIKQHVLVLKAFKYQYFAGDSDDELEIKKFERWRQKVLFSLTDQWKKMELELDERRGRI